MLDINNTLSYIEGLLWIQTKSGTLVRFKLNAAQRKLYDKVEELIREGKPVRIIILKARQLGFSTLTEGIIFKETVTHADTNSMIIAHRDDATANLFRMSRRFLENLPLQLRPKVRNSNAQELLFENPTKDPAEKLRRPGLRSRIRCVTAGGGGIGRSDTIRCLHASEYAFWPGNKAETLAGVLQALPPDKGTICIIESTANGFDDFKKRWDAAVNGESDYAPMFFAWFENPEYTMRVPEGTVWTPEELELQERYGLTDGQLQWRRWKIANDLNGDVNMFRQEFPSCPDEAFIATGSPVFDNETVIRLREAAPEPSRRGRFTYSYVTASRPVDGEIRLTNIEWQDDERGEIRLYELPEPRRPYVLGGDTAGEGSDRFTGQVIDNVSGMQVAALSQELDEYLYAHQVYCLGRYYNDALVAVEVNYSTYPNELLAAMAYPNLYQRELPDTYTGARKKAWGWRTDTSTRPAAVAGFVKAFSEHPELVRDFETLGEMLTFIYGKKRKAEAMEGEHDDLVMALIIAHAVRHDQSAIEGAAPVVPYVKLIDRLEKGRKRRRY